MRTLLRKNKVWRPYVSGKILRPATAPVDETADDAQNELDNWIEQDEVAQFDIMLGVSKTEIPYIKKCITSKQMWDKLASIYETKGPSNTISMLIGINETKIREDKDMREFLKNFNDVVAKLKIRNIEFATRYWLQPFSELYQIRTNSFDSASIPETKCLTSMSSVPNCYKHTTLAKHL